MVRGLPADVTKEEVQTVVATAYRDRRVFYSFGRIERRPVDPENAV